MRFNSNFLTQLKSALLISKIIGRKVKLIPNGNMSFKALCPFHNEKTPSFTVSDDMQAYHCFGCGVHGDVIEFVMQKEGYPFNEAVEILAREAGIALPEMSEESVRHQKISNNFCTVNNQVAKSFSNNLYDGKYKFALNYLYKRGISDEIIKKFHLGYCSGQEDYRDLSEKALIDLGIIRKNRDGGNYHFFSKRIIFPILDVRNQVIAFGGRVIGDAMPKYLNSPESEIFKKKQTLYNINHARKAAYQAKQIICVEGYMDAIAFSRNGYDNVVAPLGTAFAAEHLHLLWQMHHEPIICLDGDEAGKKAMMRITEIALPFLKPGFSLQFVLLPEGQDPDDVFSKSDGINIMSEMLNSAYPLSQILIYKQYMLRPRNTPESQAEFEKSLMSLLDDMKDAAVKAQYKKFFKEKLYDLKQIKNNKKIFGNFGTKLTHTHTLNNKFLAEEVEIFGFLMANLTLLNNENIEEEFSLMEFADDRLSKVQQILLERLSEDYNSENILKEIFQLKIGSLESLIKSKITLNKLESYEPDKLYNKWRLLIKLYHLAKIKEDYKIFWNSGDTAMQEKAIALQKDIKELQEECDILTIKNH